MWSKDPSFPTLISNHIPSYIHNPLKQLKDFQTRMQKALTQLHRNKYYDLKSQQLQARKALEDVQHALSLKPNDANLQQQEKSAKIHYNKIISSILDITRQQSKMDWIKWGDANTRFFFNKIKQRKLVMYVHELQDDLGQTCLGFDAIANLLFTFYSSLLGKSSPGKEIDQQVVNMGPLLSLEQQAQLCCPFTTKDIKEVLFSIDGIKSPGPDGFNSTFYKASWEQTGPLVCEAIQQFFKTAQLPPYYGQTKLVLLPKTSSPTMAREFRPISCCSTIYKCIAKLLTIRLKPILPSII